MSKQKQERRLLLSRLPNGKYQNTLAGDGFSGLEDESYRDQVQWVTTMSDYLNKEEREKLSGEVKTYHINDLPAEERKKYAKK